MEVDCFAMCVSSGGAGRREWKREMSYQKNFYFYFVIILFSKAVYGKKKINFPHAATFYKEIIKKLAWPECQGLSECETGERIKNQEPLLCHLSHTVWL